MSFSSRIRCLQKENADLTVELSKVKDAAQEESKARQMLEEKLKASEAGLWAAHSEMERLKGDKAMLSAQADRLSWRLSELEKGRTVALSALRRCSSSSDSCSQ
jgi:chromosome segregation ATPase